MANDFRRVVAAGVDEVIVVDGSPADDFERHSAAWQGLCRHLPLDGRWRFLNGKVNGVLTGIEAAIGEHLILADDDVVYEARDIDRMRDLLASNDLVVPQNYFSPLPWWARIETGRILLNRACRPEGDYPGTFGVRRDAFMRVGPYDGNVLFENEEMRRHLCRNGCRVLHARDFLIARRPASFRKWREQRLRQAYEDLDLPSKTAAFAALVPLAAATGVLAGGAAAATCLGVLALGAMAFASRGRRGRASEVVPASTCLTAPLWVMERAVTVHVALWTRLARGGCLYGDRRIARGISRMGPA